MTCPLCTEPILDTQSRVCVYFKDALREVDAVAYCHRTCAAKQWPETYTDHPKPTGPLL